MLLIFYVHTRKPCFVSRWIYNNIIDVDDDDEYNDDMHYKINACRLCCNTVIIICRSKYVQLCYTWVSRILY